MLNKYLEQDNRGRILPPYVISSRHEVFEIAAGNYLCQISRDASVFQASILFTPRGFFFKNIMVLLLGLILEYNAGALITDWR